MFTFLVITRSLAGCRMIVMIFVVFEMNVCLCMRLCNVRTKLLHVRYGCWNEINYKIGWATCGLRVADVISDNFMSIGTRVSYNVGACNMMLAVPTMTAIVNNHKNKRSNTIATYFQSSFT